MSSRVPKSVMHYGAALGQLSPCRLTFVTAHSVNATHDIKKVTCGQCLRIVNPSKPATKVAPQGSRALPASPAICEIRRVKAAVLRAQLDDEQFHLIANAVVELEQARRRILELEARAVDAEARASRAETERDDARRELDPDVVPEPPPVLGDLAPGNADRARALNACRLADGRTWLDAVTEAAEEEQVDLESVIEGAANISAQRARWKAWCTIRLLTSAETTFNDIGELFGVTGRQVSSKLSRLSEELTQPVVPHAPRPALVSRRTKVEGLLEPVLPPPPHPIPTETRDVVLERTCYRDVVLERELIRRFREGDELAGAKLAEMHRPLLRTVVKSFQNKGVDVEDLEQESLIGFLHGVKKFDGDRGVRLTTYSLWWVRHFVSRYVKNHRSTIRVPIYVQESKKASDEAQQAAAAVHYHMSSLDEPASDESNETLQDRLASERAGPDGGLMERTTQKRRRELIDTALQKMTLTQVQREIVTRRLLCEEPETLQSVADLFNISRERVRQIETEIMERFRREIGRLLENGELQTLLTG